MTAFPLHDENTAPATAREALEAVRQDFGMIPNLERVMASSPALLKAYSAAWSCFGETSLSPVERQVVYLTANFENDCEYCVPWHTLLAKQAGMEDRTLSALREGYAIPDARLEALRRFSRALIASRGKITEGELGEFFSAGYSPAQALEVVLGLAVKLMSNFTNSIAGTPLDRVVAKHRWRKNRIAMRDE